MTNISSLVEPDTTPAATAAPTTADAARARRDQIIADPALGEKYRNGDIALRAEMRTLNMAISAAPAGDKLSAVLAGTATPGGIESVTAGELTTSELSSAVDGLRKQGHSDQVIREIIEGAPVTAERHREAEIIRERLLRDREWLRNYCAGSSDHVQQMHNLIAVIAAPIAETK